MDVWLARSQIYWSFGLLVGTSPRLSLTLSHLPSSSPVAQYTRNQKAHGGSLKTDTFIIQAVPIEKARLEIWKNTIRRYYGINYEILSAKIDTLPLKFIEVLEERFSVLSLKVWGKSRYRTVGEASRLEEL